MNDHDERQADIEAVTQSLALLMLRYGERYDYDNAGLSDARSEAEAIVSLALADEEANTTLGTQINELMSAVSRRSAENHRLRIAFHDAIRRPLGVTPDSGAEFYDARMADEAEARRPR